MSVPISTLLSVRFSSGFRRPTAGRSKWWCRIVTKPAGRILRTISSPGSKNVTDTIRCRFCRCSKASWSEAPKLRSVFCGMCAGWWPTPCRTSTSAVCAKSVTNTGLPHGSKITGTGDFRASSYSTGDSRTTWPASFGARANWAISKTGRLRPARIFTASPGCMPSRLRVRGRLSAVIRPI